MLVYGRIRQVRVKLVEVVLLGRYVILGAKARKALVIQERMHVTLVDAGGEDVESKVKLLFIDQKRIINIALYNSIVVI